LPAFAAAVPGSRLHATACWHARTATAIPKSFPRLLLRNRCAAIAAGWRRRINLLNLIEGTQRHDESINNFNVTLEKEVLGAGWFYERAGVYRHVG